MAADRDLLCPCFQQLLAGFPADRSLVIIIDSVDLLGPQYSEYCFRWLPPTLKVIIGELFAHLNIFASVHRCAELCCDRLCTWCLVCVDSLFPVCKAKRLCKQGKCLGLQYDYSKILSADLIEADTLKG